LKRLKNFIEAQSLFSKQEELLFLERSNFIGFSCMRENFGLKKKTFKQADSLQNMKNKYWKYSKIYEKML
jgi:hypothetical protein